MYYWSNIWRRKNGRLFDSGTVYLVQRAPAWANIHVMAQGKRSCNLSGLTDGWPPHRRSCQKKVVRILNFFLIIVLLLDLWACVVASLTIWVTLDFSTGKTKRHEHVSHLCNRKTTFGQMFRINHVENQNIDQVFFITDNATGMFAFAVVVCW